MRLFSSKIARSFPLPKQIIRSYGSAVNLSTVPQGSVYAKHFFDVLKGTTNVSSTSALQHTLSNYQKLTAIFKKIDPETENDYLYTNYLFLMSSYARESPVAVQP